MIRFAFPLLALPAAFLLLVTVSASAQTAPAPPAAPLYVSVGGSNTRLTELLAALAKHSGVPILADDTVVDTVGTTTFNQQNLTEIFDAIVVMLPAVSWQRIEIPRDVPIPDANALSAQVRELTALTPSRLTVTDSAGHTVWKFSKSKPDTGEIADTPDRTIYLFTNETVRAQRLANVKAKEAKAQGDANVSQTISGLQAAATGFAQLTPDQQRQTIPALIATISEIRTAMDPDVSAEADQVTRETTDPNTGAPLSGPPPPGP